MRAYQDKFSLDGSGERSYFRPMGEVVTLSIVEATNWEREKMMLIVAASIKLLFMGKSTAPIPYLQFGSEGER